MYTSSYVEEFGPTKLYATRVLAHQSVTCGAPESIVIGSPFVTRVGTPERDRPDIVIILLRGYRAFGERDEKNKNIVSLGLNSYEFK